jgi:hypothetical protein
VRPAARTADPYLDDDVVDSHAPRFNQVTLAILSTIGVVTGFWPILAALAIQLGIGLRFGRQYCLPCVVYFKLIQPRFGEGPVEDARPPRFAIQVGFTVLSAASLAYLAGLTPLGVGLGILIAVLAGLGATTGLCLGCELYKVGARLRGVRRRQLDRIDLADLGVDDLGAAGATQDLVVSFGHPLCTDCQAFEAEVRASGRRLVSIDVRRDGELARKYGVALVPTAVAVRADGLVTARLAG